MASKETDADKFMGAMEGIIDQVKYVLAVYDNPVDHDWVTDHLNDITAHVRQARSAMRRAKKKKQKLVQDAIAAQPPPIDVSKIRIISQPKATG